ncbi:MAG: [protein-PII] uridylyltransferase, partial [Acidimicrobiales bacterium]
ADLRVQLGLLDGRLVAGDAEIGEPVLARARELWRSRAAQWLPVLANQVILRHRTHGDVAFLLEPDLKEAHGGLRDLSGLHAAVIAAPALSRDEDIRSLDPARRVLLSVRVELHRRSSRPVEKLVLQEQDAIAAALGYVDADALMFDVARAGRSISWVGDDIWSRSALWQVTKKRRRWLPGGEEPVGPREIEVEKGVSISEGTGGHPNGEVVLSQNADPGSDASLILRMAAVAAERDLPLGASSLEELGEKAPVPSEPWPVSIRTAFVRLLEAGAPEVRVIEALDHFGLFARYLPEWDTVRNKPQRNAYHRFTVDRHLLEAASNAARLAEGVSRPDLLVVGTLLHDIGKGSPGDHTEVGIDIVERIGNRMGFSPEDVRTLVDMVRYHLLLPDLATRRDLDDPATIAQVKSAAGDRKTLELLAGLTEADSLATGPAAWGPWKAGLVTELVNRTAAAMEGKELPDRATASLSEENRALMSQVRETDASPIVVAEGSLVTVVAKDRPGLLASVTGVLCLHGLDLRSADVTASDDVALETFVVEPTHGRWPDWKRVRSDLSEVLAGRMALSERLAKKSADYGVGRSSPGPAHRQVIFDNEASTKATVVEVRAPDEMALLHRLTSVLFDNSLDVVAARATTVGDHVVDAFYVKDSQSGTKVEDPLRIKQIRNALAEAMSSH